MSRCTTSFGPPSDTEVALCTALIDVVGGVLGDSPGVEGEDLSVGCSRISVRCRIRRSRVLPFFNRRVVCNSRAALVYKII